MRREMFLIISILSIVVLSGCKTENVFDVSSRLKLQGDYTKSEVIDYLDEDKPAFIPLAKVMCSDNAETCLLIMEIDYKIFVDNLTNMFAMCGVNLEDSDIDDYTEEQINCSRKIAQEIGFGDIE